MTKELVIVRPDDWHLHLRDEDFLPITVNESAKSFARAIIMPNLVPPITKLIDAENYKRRILSALNPNLSFDPLMTLYLTEETDPKEVKEGFLSGKISAVKLIFYFMNYFLHALLKNHFVRESYINNPQN